MGMIIWKSEVEALSSEVAVEIRVSGAQEIAIKLVPFGHNNGRLKIALQNKILSSIELNSSPRADCARWHIFDHFSLFRYMGGFLLSHIYVPGILPHNR